MVKHYLSTSSPVDLEGSLMFPSPSFMESNTPALPVSVAPAGGPLKSSIVFHSLYSFSDSNSRRCLFGSWMLLLSKALRLRQPLTQKQRYAIFLINNKSILFFIKKITPLQVATSFPLRVFPCHQLATAFPLRVFCCCRLSARNISWWKGARLLMTSNFMEWKGARQRLTRNFMEWKGAR